MNEQSERQAAETRERINKGGYVPVTPLGPPPQGEPLLATQAQTPVSQSVPASQPQGQITSETPSQQDT